MYIHKYGITDENKLIEIAIIAAANSPDSLNFIENYGINLDSNSSNTRIINALNEYIDANIRNEFHKYTLNKWIRCYKLYLKRLEFFDVDIFSEDYLIDMGKSIINLQNPAFRYTLLSILSDLMESPETLFSLEEIIEKMGISSTERKESLRLLGIAGYPLLANNFQAGN